MNTSVLTTAEPHDLRTQIRTVEELIKENAFDRAADACHQAIKSMPNSPDIFRLLGLVQEHQGHLNAQIESYREAIRLNSFQPSWVYLVLGQRLQNQGHWEEAITVYRQTIQIYADSAEAYRWLGFCLERQGDELGEIESYEKAIALDAKDQPIWVFTTLVSLLSKHGQYDRANAVYEKATSVFPELSKTIYAPPLPVAIADKDKTLSVPTRPQEPETISLEEYLRSARDLCDEGYLIKAVEIYQQAIALYPNEAVLYLEVGAIQERIGDFKAQADSYRRAIELDKNQPAWAYLVLGRFLLRQGQVEDALKLHIACAELHPQNAEAHRAIGADQEKQGNVSETIERYRKAIELDPQQPEWVYTTLGNSLLKHASDFEGAIAIARQCTKLYPNGAQGQKLLANLLSVRAKQSREKALDLYMRAIDLAPDDLESYYSAIELQPNDARLYLLLSHALERQGEFERAATFRSYARGNVPTEEPALDTKVVRENAFDWKFYITYYSDLSFLSCYEDAFRHWAEYGQKEGRVSCVAALYEQMGVDDANLPSNFSYSEYLEINPDLKEGYGDNKYAAITHFLKHGQAEGRYYSFDQLYYSGKRLDRVAEQEDAAIAITNSKMAALVSISSLELWIDSLNAIESLSIAPHDLFVSLDSHLWTPEVHEQICLSFPDCRLLIAQQENNRVEQYLSLMDQLQWDQYDVLTLIHANKDTDSDSKQATNHRKETLSALLGSLERLQENLDILRSNGSVGLISSHGGEESNFSEMDQTYFQMLDELGVSPEHRNSEYIPGPMMMVKTSLIQPVFNRVKQWQQSKAAKDEYTNSTLYPTSKHLENTMLRLLASNASSQHIKFYWQE